MKVLFAILSYLFGAFPTGYILYYLCEKKDIRAYGSQSIGATNMLRLKGWLFALPVIFMDILKGFLPVFLALKLFPDKRFALLCGFLAVLGHCFPIYIKLKGGKGVATAVGVYLALALLPLFIGIGVFLIIIALTRYVSLGSILAMLSMPFSIYFVQGNQDNAILSIAIFLLIVIKHGGNVRRLIDGNERKLGEKE
ncbi:MAG: glycerol-3-phosphate 1-O-acyltransferase PlsY [Candidatus Aminicenantes bacterium]|nr:MAG: glycerol-3-phosphate 1-O-acyltransferase PlsY [Candidatus Aminicenantes bacterium]